MFILRHGETHWNVEGLLQGWLDSGLTERGRAQARRQGEILRRVGVEGLPVYASPLGRALETARLAMPGIAPIPDARLREVGLGDWQGLSYDDVARISGAAAAAPASIRWKFNAPGGERLEEMLARLEDFLADAPAEAVVVTHGVAAQILRGRLMGLDLDGMDALDDQQGIVWNCSAQGEELLTR